MNVMTMETRSWQKSIFSILWISVLVRSEGRGLALLGDSISCCWERMHFCEGGWLLNNGGQVESLDLYQKKEEE